MSIPGRLFLKLFIYLTFLSYHPVYANDSLAGLAGGGLVLLKNEKISMLSEDLYISRDLIEVNYVFQNLTDKDIKTLVAFPLPEAPAEYSGDISGASYDENGQFIIKDFVRFQVWVDGKEINPKLSSKKEISSNGQFKGEEVFQLTYYWEQTFPAKKSIKVRHTYNPLVGGRWGATENSRFFSEAELDKRYCFDQSFKSSLYQQYKKGYNSVWGEDVAYILKTGGNWAGGTIGDFHLVVDKGASDSIVSFCGNNVKKVGPTRFELRSNNYKPAQDIFIMFIDKNNFN